MLSHDEEAPTTAAFNSVRDIEPDENLVAHVVARVSRAKKTSRRFGLAPARPHFALQAGGHRYGGIYAENWRAWNFSIRDHADVEVARITKTWEGLAKTLFTTADNYVVQFHRPLEDPLRSLVVAAALGVDTALKQDSRGFG